MYIWILFSAIFGTAHAQEGLGLCDTNAKREQQTVEFIVESRSDTNFAFVAKRPCTNETVKIQRCAVIKVREDKFQHFCRGTGRPTYYEEVDVIEYWGQSDKPSGR
jgi:hypothetical protein